MDRKTLDTIKTFIMKKIDPNFIIIFGSYISGNIRPESDLDVAFYRDRHSLSAYDIFNLAQELTNLAGVPIDLIDLSMASTVFQAEILSSGQLLYAKDENLLEEYRMRIFGMYWRLNEERSEIIKNIKESGRVYEY